MKYGTEPVEKHSLKSLRVLGTVGEPINPPAWKWYFNVVGKGRCSIVDTYWQTETGGIVMTALPGATPQKPGSTTFPFFGIAPVLLDGKSGKEIKENDRKGLLCISRPWPSVARTIYGDHQRYLRTYMKGYPGYYFTGDECYRDKDGYYWIRGRVDDVINVSGHRLGTAEIENALTAHIACSEAAVIAIPHDIKGFLFLPFISSTNLLFRQAIFCYCCLKEGFDPCPDLEAELKMEVRRHIGAFATPDRVILAPGLPKTRSGKIMRRVLRKIATHESSAEQLGDISTMADPDIIPILVSLCS